MKTPTRRPGDPMKAAEAVFKRTPKPTDIPPTKPGKVPAGKETVSLSVDNDVLAHFQAEGPGWRERINAALRKTAGLDGDDTPGLRPDELNATNDD